MKTEQITATILTVSCEILAFPGDELILIGDTVVAVRPKPPLKNATEVPKNKPLLGATSAFSLTETPETPETPATPEASPVPTNKAVIPFSQSDILEIINKQAPISAREIMHLLSIPKEDLASRQKVSNQLTTLRALKKIQNVFVAGKKRGFYEPFEEPLKEPSKESSSPPK